MTLLAIDTSEQACSVALIDGGRVLDASSELIGRGHAERLLPLIEERLAAGGLGYGSLSRIAVTTGPGTFTGLRIGLSVARGLALALDLPCIGLTGLQVLAAQALAKNQAGNMCVHAVITGRGGQAFLQSFSGMGPDGMPQAQSVPQGLDAADIATILSREGGSAIGSGVALLEEEGLLPVRGPASGAYRVCSIDPAVLGLLAEHLAPADYLPEPTYFRSADAQKASPALKIAGSDASSDTLK